MPHRDDPAERIAALSPERRALLEKLRGRRSPPVVEEVPRPHPAAGACPVSYAQERLWLLDRLAPGRSDYNIAVALRIRGRLDVAALKGSLDAIIGRHAALRTHFDASDGVPIQVINAEADVPLPVQHLDHLTGPALEAEARRLSHAHAQAPFDLGAGPLLRARLLCLGPDRHDLLLAAHHIVCDGWSLGVFQRELGAVYAALTRGRPPVLSPLPVQYKDFAAWERKRLQGPALSLRLDYWRRHLGELSAPFELPTDAPRVPVRTRQATMIPIVLPESLSAAIKALSGRLRTTRFVVLMTALQALLSRFVGRDDVLVAVPVANRRRREFELLIGLFVNTLVLRTDLSGNPTFEEAVARVAEVAVEAFEHQEMPFAYLVQSLQPRRGADSAPFTRVAFTFLEEPGQPLRLPGLTTEITPLSSGVMGMDLVLGLREESGRLVGSLDYPADLFASAKMERLASDFVALLEAGTSDTGRRLATPRSTEPSPRPCSGERVTASPECCNLTKNQLLIWFNQRLRPDEPIHNEVLLAHIRGPVELGRFRQAFAALVESTDALRATIEEVDGVPRQQFASREGTLDFVDLSADPDPPESLRRAISGRKAIPLNTGRGLHDAALFRLDLDRHVFYLCMHQLITDAWSFALLYQRLSELYSRLADAGADDIPAFPSFRDVADEEQRQRGADRQRVAQEFFRKKCAEPCPPLPFYGRPAGRLSTRVERVRVDLGSDRSRRLMALCGCKEFASLTPDLALLQLFAVLVFAYLHRVNDARHYSLGVPFHNRVTRALRETVGALMVVCPLRVEITPGETFASLGRKVQAEVRTTLQHTSCPIPNPPAQRAWTVLLNYINVHFGEFAGMACDTELTHSGHDDSELAVTVRRNSPDGAFTIYLDFNVDLFHADQRDRASAHLLRLLDGLLEDATRLIEGIDLRTEGEKELLRRAHTVAQLDAGLCVLQRIEVQAGHRPATVALAADDGQLTYQELEQRADRLARRLRRDGARPGAVIGVCLGRGVNMVVGLLGALKTGAAYVPLPPTDPPERVHTIVAETRPLVILTERRWPHRWNRADPPALNLDEEEPGMGDEPGARPPQPGPDDLAYIAYTSGSTGRPKGVLVPHKALRNLTVAIGEAFGLGPGDRVLNFASLGFDAAVEEIFPCLARGATLVLTEDNLTGSPAAFLEKCRGLGVTVLDLPTAYWHRLVSESEPRDWAQLDRIRLVVIGGEQASPAAVVEWKKKVGERIVLLNTYGPTEATVTATLLPLTSEKVGGEFVPVGVPLVNVRAHVLHSSMAPVPVGAMGELFLGGAGIARGYLGDPAQTAARFVPDPWAECPGERLYRTGDRARWGADANLEIHGRLDRQVKVRGHRVEPGEVEAVLCRHPGVLQAVVQAMPAAGQAGTDRLLAYLVPRAVAPEPAELQRFLGRWLPEALIPGGFVFLPALPLTKHGKIDYGALPATPATLPSDGAERVAPRTDEERVLARFWAELLAVEFQRLGVFDNFFNLGGHSLLGTQLMARLKRRFGVELPLGSLFDAPTIDGLMQALVYYKARQTDPARLEEVLSWLEGLSEWEVETLLVGTEVGPSGAHE